MAFAKPNVNYLWASEGEIVEPPLAKVNQGWVSEIPDYEFENWIQNRMDQFAAHVNQYGVPVWDNITEYIANKSYVQASDGVIYKALTTNTNSNPTTNPLDWTKAFDDAGTSYTEAEADARFLRKSNNLSDLGNVASARTTLSVYSKGESDSKYQTPEPLVGMVVAFPTTTAPTGWLKCDGSAVSRSTYLTLFNRIGTIWGNGDGSTTFNLPDLRGEFIRGFDDGRGIDSGRAFGSSQADELKSHNHTGTTNTNGSHSHTGTALSDGNHRHDSGTGQSGDSDGYDAGGVSVGGGTIYTSFAGNHTHILSINSAGSHSHTLSISSTGGSETRPRNVAMLYCIKV